MINQSTVRGQFKNIPNDLIQSYIDAAIADWEMDTGGLWNSRTGYTEVFDLRDNKSVYSLFTTLVPVTNITSVSYSSDGVTYVEYDESFSALFRDRVIRSLSGPWNQNYVKVVYDGGWTSETCPANVRLALLAQIGLLHKRLSDSFVHISGQNFEGGSGTLHSPDRHPLFRSIANTYIRVSP